MDPTLSRVSRCQFPITILAFNLPTLDNLLDFIHGGSSFITFLINLGLFHPHLKDAKGTLHISFCFQLDDSLVYLGSAFEILFYKPMLIFSKDAIS